jgi:hypothetical protein
LQIERLFDLIIECQFVSTHTLQVLNVFEHLSDLDIFISGEMAKNDVVTASIPPILVLTTTAPWKSVSSNSSTVVQKGNLPSQPQGISQARSLQPIKNEVAGQKQLTTANNVESASPKAYLQNNQTTPIAVTLTSTTSLNKLSFTELITTPYTTPTTLATMQSSASGVPKGMQLS